MTPTVVIAASDSFISAASSAIADGISRAIAARGTCALALCGGATPTPVYLALRSMPVRWADVTIYFGDERAVPPNHPDSNYRMARRALIDRAAIPISQVHRMEAERLDRDAAASEYAALLPDHLDLLLLGIGPDGHTASLFPDSAALTEVNRRVLAVPPPPPPILPMVDRMTITPLVIAAARQVMVLVQGREKAAILKRILEGPEQPTVLPAQFARSGTWIVDQAAAADLQQRDS